MSKAIREAEKRARERVLQRERKPFEELREAAKIRPWRALKPEEREREQYIDRLKYIKEELMEALKTARRLNLKKTAISLEKAISEVSFAELVAKGEWV